MPGAINISSLTGRSQESFSHIERQSRDGLSYSSREESSGRQNVLRIDLSFHSLHQLACWSKVAPGVDLVLNLERRFFDDQVAAEILRALPQSFKHAHSFAMIQGG